MTTSGVSLPIIINKPDQKVPILSWMPLDNPDDWKTIEQCRNVTKLPQVFKHVALMCDGHIGIGSTVGSVIATKGTVIPAAVGVDIGCGMLAVRTNLDSRKLHPRRLEAIRDGILARIPVGFHSHKSLNKSVQSNPLWSSMKGLACKDPDLLERAKHQLGTLGGGNHFIEIEEDQDGAVWIMLHSGSRNIGLQLANAGIRTAKKLPHNQNLPDKALSTLFQGTAEYEQYMYDLMWAQGYAAANRGRMKDLITDYLKHEFPSFISHELISCHHNFAQMETHFGEKVVVTRKGAILAEQGQWGIIPGAMGNKSYIVKGKGCAESFNSAPHGAGRKMSRTKAKAKYDFKDLEETMNGIVCNATRGTVDEIRHSYKNIDTVMSYASDLVEPVHELTQLLNIKG